MNSRCKFQYQNTLPPLGVDEYESLKHSIDDMGLLHPIIINEDNVILDGHHRFKICEELGIKPIFVTQCFVNRILEEYFVIESNLRRRQLNEFQKAEIVIRLLPIEQKIAKQRKLTGTHVSNETKGRATSKVARIADLSTTTFERARKIIESKNSKLIEDCRSGKKSISSAYWELLVRQRQGEIIPLPAGEFDVIYADPPWKFENNPSEGAAEHQYPTMSVEEISKIKIPAHKNAILFLWVPSSKLPDALKVIEEWGFKFKTSMCWVKEKDGVLEMGLGYYVRSAHELLLISTKGNVSPPLSENRPLSVQKTPKTKHSEKPTIFYKIIENMYPKRKYLELFARKKYSDYWTVWGNQVDQDMKQLKITKEVCLGAFQRYL